MYKINCKFTTDQGALLGGTLVEEKEMKKHFSQGEIEEYIEDGLITKFDFPQDGTENEPTLEELLEAEPKTLKVDYLKQACEHYKLSTAGKKDDLIARIEAFELLLESDLEEIEDHELRQVAAYYEVDETLESEEMIEAIEEASVRL